MCYITNRYVIYDTDFIHIKAYLLLINILFIFNIHFYLINESKVKIKYMRKKIF